MAFEESGMMLTQHKQEAASAAVAAGSASEQFFKSDSQLTDDWAFEANWLTEASGGFAGGRAERECIKCQ
jgi:hypothetical protein